MCVWVMRMCIVVDEKAADTSELVENSEVRSKVVRLFTNVSIWKSVILCDFGNFSTSVGT